MRILVVTNLYPPHHVGGYELRCREVVRRLRQRDNELHVLTGRYRRNRLDPPTRGVTRTLHLSWGPPYPPENLPAMLACEAADRRALAKALTEFRPDVVDVWGMEFASQGFVTELLQAGIPVHFMLDDAWLLNGCTRDPLCSITHVAETLAVPRPASIERLCCRGLTPPSLGESRVTFVSQALDDHYRRAGFRHAHVRVRLASIDTAAYRHLRPANDPPPLRLLCAGQLSADRGQGDLLLAIDRLTTGRKRLPWPLIAEFVGPGSPEYLAELRASAGQVSSREAEFRFLKPVPPESVPILYARAHLLVHTSRRPEEALPRVLMEAMAAGLGIIATDSGGQREILGGGRWGTLVPPADADALARAIRQAIDEWPSWRRRADAAREHARRLFDLDAYVDEHGDHLARLAAASPPAPPAAQAALPADDELNAWCESLGQAAASAAGELDVETDPDQAWRLGVILKRTGRLDEATTIFERLHRARSEETTHVRRATFHLAEIALARGDWPRARDLLRMCLDVAPDHEKAAYDLAAAVRKQTPPHLNELECLLPAGAA